MIKITIDGEEVYSAKDFTIKEEMLNTPSVILNNVYPISWEQDRDYISRFYHPNDYSKCLIMNNTHIPEEPGITVTSTSINANVDTSKKYEYALMGDTQQNGTPTPDTPIPINVVSGDNTIDICGKNLFAYSNMVDESAIYRINASQRLSISQGSNENSIKCNYSRRGYNLGYLSLYGIDGTQDYAISYQISSNTTSFTPRMYIDTENSTSEKLVITINGGNGSTNGGTSNYFVLSNIQLEKGNQATTYEPYQSASYPINLGNIELCKIGDYQDYIFHNVVGSEHYDSTLNEGSWYIYKAIGKVVLDGSESWNRGSGATTRSVYALDTFTDRLSSNNRDDFYSDNFSYLGNAQLTDLGYAMSFNSGQYSNYIYIQVPLNVVAYDHVTDFKTWLSTHNTTVYYVLRTPTITEITDTDLINQLESIELFNGINNIMVSGNLPSPIQLHYNYVIEEDISDLLFCGVVKNSGYISLNPRHPHYQTLQILDFKTFLSEGETLDFVIANKTIEEAIEQVISTIEPYGFIKGNIQLLNPNDVIGAYSTKDKTAYDVFNYIADITQSRWTTRLIDENTVAIDFYDPTLLPQGSPINYTQNYFDENLIDDISYSYGSNDYRNKQVMTSSEVYGNILQTQTIVANGYQTQFDTELKIGKISSITINGVQMTFATTQEKELGYSADFYYTPGNNFFESADLRSTGQIIIISYLAIVEGRQIITNALEIDRVATSTGRKGVVARYEDRNDATTSTELQLIGQSYIKYKGVPEIKLNVTTRKNLWNIGDRVTFNAPITELATEYMVKKKEIQRVFANPSSEEVIFYKFELSSSFNMEQAINYFDNQRAKAKGNIGEGEYITRNVDIENISNVIFYDGTCEEITLVGDNTLNSILNSPFVN